MDAQQDLQRKRRVVRAVTTALAVVIAVGLWQAYGAWLLGAAGGYGS